MSELSLELVINERGNWLDFIVDNYSLHELIYGPDGLNEGAISCLTLLYDEKGFQKALDSLLLRRTSDFPNNRRALYVCPICGDLDCGAVTVVIEESENTIIWRDFGWENTCEDNVERYEPAETFVFDKVQYINTLKGAMNFPQESSFSGTRASATQKSLKTDHGKLSKSLMSFGRALACLFCLRYFKLMRLTDTPSISSVMRSAKHSSNCTPEIVVKTSSRNGGTPMRTMRFSCKKISFESSGKPKPNSRNTCVTFSALLG